MEDAIHRNWPAGHRAALILSFDIDGEYGVINRYGPDDWYWRSQAQYDLQTGIWRVLDILADFDVHRKVGPDIEGRVNVDQFQAALLLDLVSHWAVL